MPFDKVETQVDFPAQERAILEFWQRHAIFEQLREKNRGKPKWSFLDGPITANNPMGVHHAWGRTYKDAYQRYFAMTGHELRYQNGFDCQGLWVEVEVEKDYQLKSKRDIENLVPGDRFASIDQFVQRCKERVNTFAKRQTEQSIRLGYWMDWDRYEDWQKRPDDRRSYFTMSEENNYTIWSFLKKCYDRKLVYRGYDAMPWCGRCGTGISQMEMNEGYHLVAHRAPFVAFPLKDQPNENLLVWTTTPWTLTSNVAAAVNPELKYLKVRLRDQFYYLAKGAFTAKRLEEQFKQKDYKEFPRLKPLEQIFKEKAGKEGFEIVGEVTGKDMIGWEYTGPFDELPAQAHPAGYPKEVAEDTTRQGWASPKSAKENHRVIGWKDVGEAEGTGIVHIAPGCGAEDYELGQEEHLVAVAPLDETGVFLPGFGELEGKSAVEHATADWVLDNLKKKGVLLDVERYPHNYPHCWRCKTELLFRLVDEWFINMKWRDEIIAVTEQVTFLPESINGRARERDWLQNMGDWMISKKRFWGLALPIWVDEKTGDFEVIGSRAELQARAVEGWDRFEGNPPHRPWIDLVKIKNPKTGNLMSRIPDVGNPWLDAGIVPYSTMGYNHDRANWEKWFPADFITECFPGQFRNWFYAILAMSTMMEQKAPFKVLLGHGLVRDQDGEEMHKAKGNSIPFEGAADTGYQIVDKKSRNPVDYPPMSADLIRWLYCRHNPAANLNFGPGPAEELRAKFTLKLWNSYAFFVNYARLDGFDPAKPQVPVKDRPDIDRWILSDLQFLIEKAHEAFRGYNVMAFCLEAEKFIDDKLSNWYIRRNRRRFWKSEQGQDKLAAYQTLYTVLVTYTKLIAPVVPFLSEVIYRNLVGGTEERSVHLCEYPTVDTSLKDEQLSQDMDALFDLVTLGSAARNSVKIKVRQPLSQLKVWSMRDRISSTVARFVDHIRDELNVKKVEVNADRLLARKVKLRKKTAGPRLGEQLFKAEQWLAAQDQQSLDTVWQKIEANGGFAIPGTTVPLPREDFECTWESPTGWAGIDAIDIQVAIDTRISTDLKQEGQAREVIRAVQNARKDADLEPEDRITLHLCTEAVELRQAIETHRAYIGSETLVKEWADQPLGEGAFRSQVKVDGQQLTIELRKVTSSRDL